MGILELITTIASVLAIIGFNYQFLKNFKSDQDRKFDSFERKFELIENRLFQLAMGRSIKEIMEEEKK